MQKDEVDEVEEVEEVGEVEEVEVEVLEEPAPEPEPVDPHTQPRPPEDKLYKFLDSMKDACGPEDYVEFKAINEDRFSRPYELHKQIYLDRYGDLGKHGEMILIHGTDADNIPEIVSDDFSLTKKSAHGQRFGTGIYFTQNLSLACNYSERGKLTKHFIVCLVHIGDIVQGTHRMDKLPRIASDSSKYYDSSVDDITRPKQFVKYKHHTYNMIGGLTLTIHDKKSPLFRPDLVRSRPGGIVSRTPSIRRPLKKGTNKGDRYDIQIHNMLKVDVEVYHTRFSSILDKYILSDEMISKFKLPKKAYTFGVGGLRNGTGTTLWKIIQTYCLTNHLFYRDHTTGIFLPDPMLCDLFEISPTTRISVQNIKRLMKPHMTRITDSTIGLAINETMKYHTYSIMAGKDLILETFVGNEFFCGFRTLKKNPPENFVLLKKCFVSSTTRSIHYINSLDPFLN